MSRPMLCLLLIFASTTLSAREVRLQGANSGGGQCTEIANAVDEATAKPPAKPRTTAAQPRKPVKAVPTARSDGDDDVGVRVSAPRWHSFLPGMFR